MPWSFGMLDQRIGLKTDHFWSAEVENEKSLFQSRLKNYPHNLSLKCNNLLHIWNNFSLQQSNHLQTDVKVLQKKYIQNA